MTRTNQKLIKAKSLTFGAVNLSREQIGLNKQLNDELLGLCKTLPESMQTQAVLFIMEYARIQPGEPFDFFSNYYPPVWTVVHHIYKNSGQCDNALHEKALQGQALAMFLHSYDDHLTDGDIPPSHLTLLLRSSAWMKFNDCAAHFTNKTPACGLAVKNCINNYYRGMTNDGRAETLDEYCDLFRMQMATGLIMPLCLAIHTGIENSVIENIQKSYESFGIAWRLLDDINDLEEDILNGNLTAIYCTSPRKEPGIWKIQNSNKRLNKITSMLIKDGVLDIIIKKIYREMKNAEECAAKAGLADLAREYSELNVPIASIFDTL